MTSYAYFEDVALADPQDPINLSHNYIIPDERRFAKRKDAWESHSGDCSIPAWMEQGAVCVMTKSKLEWSLAKNVLRLDGLGHLGPVFGYVVPNGTNLLRQEGLAQLERVDLWKCRDEVRDDQKLRLGDYPRAESTDLSRSMTELERQVARRAAFKRLLIASSEQDIEFYATEQEVNSLPALSVHKPDIFLVGQSWRLEEGESTLKVYADFGALKDHLVARSRKDTSPGFYKVQLSPMLWRAFEV